MASLSLFYRKFGCICVVVMLMGGTTPIQACTAVNAHGNPVGIISSNSIECSEDVPCDGFAEIVGCDKVLCSGDCAQANITNANEVVCTGDCHQAHMTNIAFQVDCTGDCGQANITNANEVVCTGDCHQAHMTNIAFQVDCTGDCGQAYITNAKEVVCAGKCTQADITNITGQVSCFGACGQSKVTDVGKIVCSGESSCSQFTATNDPTAGSALVCSEDYSCLTATISGFSVECTFSHACNAAEIDNVPLDGLVSCNGDAACRAVTIRADDATVTCSNGATGSGGACWDADITSNCLDCVGDTGCGGDCIYTNPGTTGSTPCPDPGKAGACVVDNDRPRKVCFSGRDVVEVQGKGIVTIDTLQIGDSVLTADGSFSDVFSFGHWDPGTLTEFLQFTSAIGEDPLEISSDHLVYVFKTKESSLRNLVPAGRIQVGDFLVSKEGFPVEITSISQIQRCGAYAPLTTTGDIVVNGIVASNYVCREWLPKIVPGQTLHLLQHGAVLPYRIFCCLYGCKNETYDDSTGFSPWVQFWFGIEQWQLGLNALGQLVFLSIVVTPVAVCAVLTGKVMTTSMVVLFTNLVAIVVGYIIWKSSSSTNKGTAKTGR